MYIITKTSIFDLHHFFISFNICLHLNSVNPCVLKITAFFILKSLKIILVSFKLSLIYSSCISFSSKCFGGVFESSSNYIYEALLILSFDFSFFSSEETTPVKARIKFFWILFSCSAVTSFFMSFFCFSSKLYNL